MSELQIKLKKAEGKQPAARKQSSDSPRILIQTKANSSSTALNLFSQAYQDQFGPNQFLAGMSQKQITTDSFKVTPSFIDELNPHSQAILGQDFFRQAKQSTSTAGLSITSPQLSLKDNQTDGIQRTTGNLGLLLGSGYASSKLKLVEEGASAALRRPFMSNVGKRIAARRLVVEMNRRIAKEGLKAIATKGTVKLAGRGLMTGIRAGLVAVGVGSGGSLLLTLVIFEAGSYVLMDVAIPAINEAMDDSDMTVDIEHDKSPDHDRHRLIRRMYQDQTGKGSAQTNIIELDMKDANLSLGSSDETLGPSTFHASDVQEREEILYPQTEDQAIKRLRLDHGTKVYITRFDEEGNPEVEEVDIAKFDRIANENGLMQDVLNPQYQVMAVAELTKHMGIKDQAKQKRVVDMATRHLLATKSKFEKVNLGQSDKLGYSDEASLYEAYLEVYKNGFEKMRKEHGYRAELPQYMQNLEAAIESGHDFMRLYQNNIPFNTDTVDSLMLRVETKLDGDWYPGFGQRDLESIQAYIDQNGDLSQSIASDFEYKDGQLKASQSSTYEVLKHMQDSYQKKLNTGSHNLSIGFGEGSFTGPRTRMFGDMLRATSLSRRLELTPEDKLAISKIEQELKLEVSLRKFGLERNSSNQGVGEILAERRKTLNQIQEKKRIFINKVKEIAANYKTVEEMKDTEDPFQNYVALETLRAIKKDPKILSIIIQLDDASSEASTEAKSSLIKSIANKLNKDKASQVMLGLSEELNEEDIHTLVEMYFSEIVE